MALVKCPDCGKRVSPRAIACPDCGCPAEYFEADERENKSADNIGAKDERVLVNQFVRTTKSFMANEYTNQITKRVIEMYIQGKKCDANEFYTKAQFYEMGTDDVNYVCENATAIIEKLNLYLGHLYTESHGMELWDKLISEFVTFGGNLGVEEETLHLFRKFYEKKNKIIEKREYLEALLEVYAETGEFDPDQNVKRKFANSVYSEQLFEEYKKRILAMEPLIAAEYPNGKAIDLTKAQKKKLHEIAKTYHFVGDDLEALISGYEEKSGIYNQKLQISKEKVFANLNSKYSKTYLVFGGHQLKFDATYFILAELWKKASNAQELFKKNIEKTDKGASNICKIIENAFDEYTEVLSKDIEELEELLDFSTCEDFDTEIYNGIQFIWNGLGDLELDLEEILQDKKISKEERARRKAGRGRWTGGGFGVGGAIKGAATAGAMNMATGAAHTAVNLVGNAISGMAASVRKNKAVKSYLESVDNKMKSISRSLWDECTDIIDEYYPELRYVPDYHDTNEEKILREQFLSAVTDKEQKAIELLLKNPYNPLNGYMVLFEYTINKKNLLNQASQQAFDLMEKQFQWGESLSDIIEQVGKKVVTTLKEEPEDQMSDVSVIEDVSELCKVLEYMLKAEPDEKLQESYYDFRDIYQELLEKQEYINLLKNIYNLTINQVLEKGAEYCERNEYSKAKQIYIKGLKNDSTAKTIIECFFEVKDKEKMVELLDGYINRKSDIGPKTYEDVLLILSKIKNKENKTLLVYAAEMHNRKVVDELIDHNADVDMLYQLIGKDKNDNHGQSKNTTTQEKCASCKACGKKLSAKAKFCNFCGQRVE